MFSTDELTREELLEVKNCDSIGGDEEFYQMILGMVLESVDEKMAVLIKADVQADAALLFETAHAIKGSALQCSLNKLGTAAEEVEFAFKGNAEVDLETKRKLLEDLLFECTRTVNTIRRLPK